MPLRIPKTVRSVSPVARKTRMVVTNDEQTDQKLGVQSFDKLDARTHDKHSSRQTSTAVKIEPGTQGRGGKAFFAQSSNFREGDVKLDSSTKELTLDSMGKKSIQSLQRAPVRADIAETLSSRPSHQDPYILTALGDDLDAMSTSPHRHPCPMAEKAFCSATFATRQVADRHAKSAHTTKKEYFCEHCPKAFTRKDHLKQHQRTHASKA